MIKSAGRLTMSWISSGFLPAKWALMTPSAGAMAAPAMTVSKLMERMVYSNLFFIKNKVKKQWRLQLYQAAKRAFSRVQR